MAKTACLACQTPEVPWRDLGAKQSDLRYLKILQGLLERRLSYLRGRAERTEIIAAAMARAVGLGEDRLALLRLAARYHTISGCWVPLTRFWRPRTPYRQTNARPSVITSGWAPNC